MCLFFSVFVLILCIVMLLNFFLRLIMLFDLIFKEMYYNVVINKCVYDLKILKIYVKLNVLEL